MIKLEDLIQFHSEKYTRNLVLKTHNIEIILVCWLPGQASPIHGHGDSDAVHFILEGEMSFTNYFPDGRKVSGTVRPGHLDHVPVGVDHLIANHSDKPLVTLNIYSPPLQTDLQGFDLGYSNPVTLREVQLPEEIVKVLMAVPPLAKGCNLNDPPYMI
ncbi:MAG: cysteine dioxygenase family protein [Cyanobacteria bacterium]|nr:cysteine dioxygenase family protein [Cyanobacteriota bacterium]